jgi:hypothetical protein
MAAWADHPKGNIGEAMADDANKIVIGPAEPVNFPVLHLASVPARIDTGAKTSAIWASSVRQDGDTVRAVLFGEESKYYTGEELSFGHFEAVLISTSTGSVEKRYKVYVSVELHGRRVRASFTLADRSQQVYPVLIGRNVLLGKFIVDVKDRHEGLRPEKQQRDAARAKFDAAHREEQSL